MTRKVTRKRFVTSINIELADRIDALAEQLAVSRNSLVSIMLSEQLIIKEKQLQLLDNENIVNIMRESEKRYIDNIKK